MRIGIVGCGNISGIYLENLLRFAGVEVVACADLDVERAREKAARYGIPVACGVEELLADPDVDLVLNLTPPRAHAAISLAALEAGKHVYSEKPLAVDPADGRRILSLAKQKNLRVGCAPDTFFGAGLSTCRRLLREGAIGRPVGAAAFMMSRGPERWHPNPDFFYEKGGGPMFDMGPYYLTALAIFLGPVRRVTGSASISFPEREAVGPGDRPRRFPVHVPTHVAGVLDFASGAVGTIITSFDVWSSTLPHMEIYGEKGTLVVPDPNRFDGVIRLRGKDDRNWREIPAEGPYRENSRGVGLTDMVRAIRENRPHRASGELALHVLDIMYELHQSSRSGTHREIDSGSVFAWEGEDESLP
jgi:predicted dehydrogenase